LKKALGGIVVHSAVFQQESVPFERSVLELPNTLQMTVFVFLKLAASLARVEYKKPRAQQQAESFVTYLHANPSLLEFSSRAKQTANLQVCQMYLAGSDFIVRHSQKRRDLWLIKIERDDDATAVNDMPTTDSPAEEEQHSKEQHSKSRGHVAGKLTIPGKAIADGTVHTLCSVYAADPIDQSHPLLEDRLAERRVKRKLAH
jgi:hypothetical protein